ncbi:hypothetical protein OIU34_26540 [Pararhizobium sp. BT-229]|uniref:hypothetical protein n=1 Tax=Pararhizobium sp. BT-229 TaxID=2986923 RepID=UPI0021F7F601|nr:hypothetical protein [Pararhizobium sp. BT-229]MCV9965441.1 hypothetical protein [Pararhizobium sp. BT-229]
MNSNLFHNILNVVIALLGVVTAVLLATGCTTLAGGDLECSKSFIDPTYTTSAIAILGVTKTAINIGRDGLAGLVKRQPPVK